MEQSVDTYSCKLLVWFSTLTFVTRSPCLPVLMRFFFFAYPSFCQEKWHEVVGRLLQIGQLNSHPNSVAWGLTWPEKNRGSRDTKVRIRDGVGQRGASDVERKEAWRRREETAHGKRGYSNQAAGSRPSKPASDNGEARQRARKECHPARATVQNGEPMIML